MRLVGHVTKGKPLKTSHHPTRVGSHRYWSKGEITVLVCHVMPQDHVIKALCDFMDRAYRDN